MALLKTTVKQMNNLQTPALRLHLRHTIDHVRPRRKRQEEGFLGKLQQSKACVYMGEFRRPHTCQGSINAQKKT